MKKSILLLVSAFVLLAGCCKTDSKQSCSTACSDTNGVWSKQQAKQWYADKPWLSGCNFYPSSAINQIEMWQAETFDAATIDKELGWAEDLGFNLMRVYLSSVVWNADAEGLKKRMNEYLTIANKHGISTMFVFFDDCWSGESAIGKQPEPKPGVHNSGWVRDPSVELRKDTTTLFPQLEKYVKDVMTAFKDDKRVFLWDLYNEPGNSGHGINTLPLLKNTFKWAREVNPSQPISAGLWYFGCPELNAFQLANSDVITYHNYSDERDHQTWINFLKMEDRPMICTEYMARKNGSRFENIMPLLKKNNVGAINWGFVAGKSNTIYAWGEPIPSGEEPKVWFHDIYRQDNTPFDVKEVELIKKLTGKTSEVKLLNEVDFNAEIDGKQVSLYTLKNRQGMVAQITNFGGKVVTLWTPDRNRTMDDVVTGLKNIKEYQETTEGYFGALIGRYGNRIAKGKFTLDGNEYTLGTNNGDNHLHGGPKGFHNVVWEAKPFKNCKGEDALELNYLSKDGEEGYPGNLQVKVIYTLTNNNELKIDYTATTDRKTIANITHHSFFNLHGFASGVAKSINSHVVYINADNYNPTDAGLIPTGEIKSVKGTPMDFTRPTVIGGRVNENFIDLVNGKGYDHNWILNKESGSYTLAAEVYEPSNGRVMRVLTTEPAIQFYGGNFFDGTVTGKYGEVYGHRTSFAMETQHFPDSPNQPTFPTTELNPGETYTHTCVYQFDVR